VGWKRKKRWHCRCERARRARCERERKKTMGKSWTYARRTILKGQARPLASDARNAVSAELSPTSVRPGETIAHSHDASIPAEYRPATSARGHDGAVTFVTSVEMPTPIIAPTFTTMATTTPMKLPQATTATITHKSSRESLQLTHELRATSGGCAHTHPPRT
jgi:hypothetical protein